VDRNRFVPAYGLLFGYEEYELYPTSAPSCEPQRPAQGWCLAQALRISADQHEPSAKREDCTPNCPTPQAGARNSAYETRLVLGLRQGARADEGAVHLTGCTQDLRLDGPAGQQSIIGPAQITMS